jgi:Ca2+-binding RTX toxin-like protein
LPANTVQTILGGAGLDTLILPGSPSDYTFAVAYTPRGAPSADATVTSLTHAAAAGQATISASGVEKALFQGGITNAVRLTDDSVTVEMLRLADEVYGPSETLRHRAEPLAYAGEGPVQYVGSHAGDRLWHRLEAIELGMPAADYNSFETLRFSLVKGFYQAYVGGESFLGDTAEANALVLSGLVDGKQTLAIAFRGTDQPADFADYDSFARHFAKYQPLISAVKTYLDANPNITQVLLSGHSLGAGVVEHAYKALEAWDTQNGHTMAAFTDGSPGSEVATPGYLGVTFENTDDLVPLLGQVSQAANVLTRPALALALHKIGGPFLSLDDQLTITDRVLALQPKDVQGALVRITAGEPAFFRDFDEHDASLYVRELRKILSFAKDPDSPFSSSAFGQALRNNSFYAGPDLQISIGASRFPATDRSDYGLNTRYNAEFASSVTLEAGDNWALGNAVSADFFLFAGTPQDIARGRPTIDGGTGRDTLVLNGTGQDWSWNQSTGALNHAGSQVATLSRIEQVFLSSGEVLGSVANVQRPGGNAVAAFIEPGAPAAAAAGFVLQAGFDYADAGDGSFDVLGTAEADRLFVGRGDKAIDTGGGDDLIIVKASATGDRIRIDGGQGADVIFGGRGIETYVVDSAGDRVVVAAPDGMHTVVASVSFALPDNVQNLVLQSGATRGGGNALDNAITGSDGRNLLEGVEGQDTLQGAGGDDTIFGGAGSDSLTGDGGSDYVRGEDGDDRLTGGDAFDDLHGNMGNDTVSGEAGGDWVVGGKDNDLLSGGDGDDLVYGNLGADTCEGGPGADIVRGGQQDDILRGGDGNDILFGDRDADTISGEAGADIFSTHGDAGLDRVLDFRIAEGDRVQLLPGTKYTLAQVGADTVISMTGGGQMVLVDVQVSTLTGNWIFGA